jgi:ubiquinone/menaquinone biosynthesis C-methylase UbiE
VAAVLNAHTQNFIPLAADLTHIPIKAGSFDVVICVSVLEHIKDLKTAFEEMSRVIRQEGILILGFPMKNKLTKMLLSLIGYDDSLIHPSGHEQILMAAREKFTLKGERIYPSWMSKSGLYYTGCFKKK